MRVYLETSALIAFLFGELSDSRRERQAHAAAALARIRVTEGAAACVSLYTLQELLVFVREAYPPALAAQVLRLALRVLWQYPVELLPLLDRMDTLRYSRTVRIPDRSDLPHAASALKHGCNALLTYDSHFASVAGVRVLSPEEFVASLSETRTKETP